MNEYTPDQMEHRAITDDLSTGQYRLMQVNEEAARREKAALFDVLAARPHEWHPDIQTLFIHNDDGAMLSYNGATLAEAVKRAMESEGKEK